MDMEASLRTYYVPGISLLGVEMWKELVPC